MRPSQISNICSIILYIIYSIQLSDGCKREWFGYEKKIDCIEYLKSQQGKCDDKVMIKRGEQQAADMTVGLYKGVTADVSVNQANFLLFPREIARVISALIEATGKAATKTQQETLHQIRCHIDTVTKSMMSTIEVPNDDEKNFGGAETKLNITKGEKPPKMLSLVRNIFLDKNLKPAQNYSKESYCWYHIPIVNTVSFKDGNATIKSINQWADKASIEAVKNMNPKREDVKLTRRPLADDPELIQNDRAVIASSILLQVRWANNLFQTKDTLLDQEFMLENSKKNAVTKVKVPLMKGFGSFKLINTKSYKAVELPTEVGGVFIIALPKDKNSLSTVESEIVKNGRSLDAFIETVRSAKEEENFNVMIPRLSIQIIHEWSTPENKNLDVFSNETGNGITGDQVAVYQDTYLELAESVSSTSDVKSKNDTIAVLEPVKTVDMDKLFKADRPFFFVFMIKSQIVALGRVKDPNWCKNCKRSYKAQNDGTNVEVQADLSEDGGHATDVIPSQILKKDTKDNKVAVPSSDERLETSQNPTLPNTMITEVSVVTTETTTESSNNMLMIGI